MKLDLGPELTAWLASGETQENFKALMEEAVDAKLTHLLDGELLCVAGAANFLSMTEGAVRKAVERGEIPCVRLGRRVRFRRSELLRFGR